MIERFTDPSRLIVSRAQEEALLLKHNYLGTEHLLLAMFSLDEDEPVNEALASVGVTYELVRGEAVELVGVGGMIPSPPTPFTPFTKRSLELALRQMLQLEKEYIEPAHILLGILDVQRQGEVIPVALRALLDLGVDLDALRYAIIVIMERDS